MAEDIYTAAGWESMYQNGYVHGSPSRFSAKSAKYTAAGCQHIIAIYTAAVPELFQTIYTAASKQEPTYKATHDMNKSRENDVVFFFFFFFFCFRNDCLVNTCIHSYWRHGISVDNKFFMENSCRVNNAFILDERQPCIKTIWHEKRLPWK